MASNPHSSAMRATKALNTPGTAIVRACHACRRSRPGERYVLDGWLSPMNRAFQASTLGRTRPRSRIYLRFLLGSKLLFQIEQPTEMAIARAALERVNAGCLQRL